MKRYLPKNAEDASALIITLLVIVLLSTIAVSFFSNARIEQTATRNYSSKTQAEQFAMSATQQAMATLQSAFNDTGSMSGNYTGIATSQPGAIKKFFFQNGNCTKNATTNLFFASNSTNANGTVNLNNLANSTNSTLAGLITGNVSENISVYRVDLKDSSGNQIIGRIAYYVDDEGTKINLNSASSNRSTLNIANSRGLSLSALSNNTTTLDALDNIVAGNSTASSNMTTWTSFFRQEHAQKGLALTNAQIVATSVAPLRDFHMKYTPWGARRLFINDTTEVTLDTAGVNKVVTALSDTHLKNIYGQTYADKYTLTGLKQIAANMLQKRSKDTIQAQSYAFKGGLIGSDNLDANGIPKEYLGYAPYAAINEVGMTGRLAVERSGGQIKFRIILQACVECGIWELVWGGLGGSSNATLVATLANLTYDVSYSSSGSPSTVSLGGSWGAGGGGGGSFSQFYTNTDATYTQRVGYEDPKDWRWGDSQPGYWDPAIKPNRNRNSGNPSLSSIGGAYSSRYHMGMLGRPSRIGEISAGFSFSESSNITISGISNVKASIKNILLLANGTQSSSIRDWVVGGSDIGDFNIPLVTYANGLRTTTNSTVTSGNTTTTTTTTTFPTMDLPLTYSNGNFTYNASATTITTIVTTSNNTTTTNTTTIMSGSNSVTSNSIATWADPEPINAPAQSYARIDPQLKSITSAGNYTSNPWPALASNCTWAWAQFGNSTWGTAINNGTQTGNAPAGYGFTGMWDNFYNYSPYWTKNNTIQGDPLQKPWTYSQYLHFYHHRNSLGPGYMGNDGGIFSWPYLVGVTNFLDAAGNNLIVCPADLGKVPTNYPWRKLRMQLQPKNEVSSANGGGNLTSQTLIPDWAILDVISFGMNSSATLPLNYATPANANNKFVTANGTMTSNRINGLLGLTKAFDNATVDRCQILQNPQDLSKNTTAEKVAYSLGADLLASARTSGNITANLTWSQLVAANIGNITWSPVSYWGSSNSVTTTIRKNRGYPSDQIVLPSEIVEIRDIADLVTTNSTTYDTTTRFNSEDSRFFKLNEYRLSPFFPGLTTCSNFFTIYAYAQALDKSGNLDSEALTKTLVEVEIATPATSNGTTTTPAIYKVKKLYTQPIPMGE